MHFWDCSVRLESWWWLLVEGLRSFRGPLHWAAGEFSWHGSWLTLALAIQEAKVETLQASFGHLHHTLLVTEHSPDLLREQQEVRVIWSIWEAGTQIWIFTYSFIQQIFTGVSYMPSTVLDTNDTTSNTTETSLSFWGSHSSDITHSTSAWDNLGYTASQGHRRVRSVNTESLMPRQGKLIILWKLGLLT